MIETYAVPRPKRFASILILGLIGLMVLLLPTWLWRQTQPPADFPLHEAVVIPRGLSASSIADLLDEAGVVRSGGWLYAALILWHDPASVQAGTYLFTEPLSVFEVARRITDAAATDNLVALTLPEGFTYDEFAKIAGAALPAFDAAAFRAAVQDQEGFLFPDTYFVPADFTADELEALLTDTYTQKTASFDLDKHPLGEAGVIVLASILEREANTEESMRLVSGVLQNRLAIDMPLQADATLEYVLVGRSLNELTAADIENIDSPYNTYKYRGLPPTPIGNPGLQAIRAVLDPLDNDYLYYVTDAEGQFHFARTFDEHKRNIERYLR